MLRIFLISATFLATSGISYAGGFESHYQDMLAWMKSLGQECSKKPYDQLADCERNFQNAKNKFEQELELEKSARTKLSAARYESRTPSSLNADNINAALKINARNQELISDCIKSADEELHRVRVKMKTSKPTSLDDGDFILMPGQ